MAHLAPISTRASLPAGKAQTSGTPSFLESTHCGPMRLNQPPVEWPKLPRAILHNVPRGRSGVLGIECETHLPCSHQMEP